MVVAPTLAFPNPSDPFILDTDASDRTIGGELCQVQDKIERTIAFASNSLTPAQARYCTTRKELLAVVKFTRHYRHYLLGRQFIVRTDHGSLVWLMRFKNVEGQLARWLEELSQYDMVIAHRAGSKHRNADGLSRIPDTLPHCDCYQAGKDPSKLPCGGCNYCTRAHSQWSRFEDDVDDVVPLAIRAVRQIDELDPSESDGNDGSWMATYSADDLRQRQLADADVARVIEWLENDVEPCQKDLTLSSPVTKQLWQCRQHLVMRDGTLYYRWVNHPSSILKLVVPNSLKPEILRLGHNVKSASHPGRERTYARIRRSFYWPRMSLDVKTYVGSCAECIKSKKPHRKPKAELGSYHAGSPMERVHIDILGPLTLSDNGNKYILALVDQFTKWIECSALPDQTAERVATAAINDTFSRLGLPLRIHSDQGRQFEGQLFQELCDKLEIAKTRTTPYRPCSNGQVECYNRVILQTIRCYLQGKEKSWDRYLPLITMALRATEHSATGFTPNMMMLGREVNLPLELVAGATTMNSETPSPSAYVSDLVDRMSDVHNLARDHIRQAQSRQKKTYDAKLCQSPFARGDLVYKLETTATKPGHSRKLKPVYTGPLLVTKVFSPVTFQIEGRKKIEVLHHDRLRPCPENNIPLWMKRKRHHFLKCGSLNLPEFDNLPSDDTDGNSSADSDDSDEHRETADIDRTGGNQVSDQVAMTTDNENGITNPDTGDHADGSSQIESSVTTVIPGSDTEVNTNTTGTGSRSRAGRTLKKPGHLRDYDLC